MVARMANESIELLKPYEPKRMEWPALHMQKIDGVPVRMTKTGGKIKSVTRQNEPVKSVAHIERFADFLLLEGETVVMEMYIAGKPFKEISGLVRKGQPCTTLIGYVFDFDNGKGWPYNDRLMYFTDRRRKALDWADGEKAVIQMIPHTVCDHVEAADAAHEALMFANPKAEGSVLHSVHKKFQPGKRLWTTQKLKPIPTIDLLVVGFEEAISAETGLGLGMVGRVNAEFNKTLLLNNTRTGEQLALAQEVIGIGPGALTHTERKELWRMWKKGQYAPRIAEIKYMRDDSYDALRQPTFKCWRDDKKEPDGVY
jgi:ATP-dependent DNA ligase